MRLKLAALASALLITSGCVVASPDTDTYGDAAASTLGTAVSEVATVRTLLELLVSGDIQRPAVVAQLRYSEDALAAASQGFGSLNPPVGSDKLSEQTGRMLDEAGTLIQDARVAVHRGKKADYRKIVEELDDVGARLEKLEASAS